MDISPNVNVIDTNTIVYIPKEIPEIAAFVGFFEKGPINTPVFITDILQFKEIFGRGIGMYHNDWYQVFNYLQYVSGIWVLRASGSHIWNASNGEREFILEEQDFIDIKQNLQTLRGVRVFAKQPGEFGNLYSVAIITKNEWDNNVFIKDSYKAKNVFSFFEENYYGICVFRKDQLVESFYLEYNELDTINDSSYFLYWKFSSNIISSFGNDIIKLSGGSVTVPTDDDLVACYDILKNKDQFFLDIIIGNEFDNSLAVKVAEYRRDCIAFIGLPTRYIQWLTILLENKPKEVLYTVEGLPLAIKDYYHNRKFLQRDFDELDKYINSIPYSQFCHFTLNIKRQLDGFTNKPQFVNVAADIAGLKAKASLNTPWTPGAGIEKGTIRNALSYVLNFNKEINNSYYKRGLNFIENNIVMTQKTFLTEETNFNRINIRSLFNYIEKSIEFYIKRFVFEDNSLNTRRMIAGEIKRILDEIKSNNGIQAAYSYVTIGDNNSIRIDIQIQPTYVTEYISLRLNNVGSRSMTEIIN